MTQETGPIYGVPLIDTLPLGTGLMRQAMPGRDDLAYVRQFSERVAAGYEVLLSHYTDRGEQIQLLEGRIAALELMNRPKVIDGSGS